LFGINDDSVLAGIQAYLDLNRDPAQLIAVNVGVEGNTVLKVLSSDYIDEVDLEGTKLNASKSGLKLVKFDMKAQLVSPKSAQPAAAAGKGKGKKGKGAVRAPGPQG
jgi:hypothetical protein